MSRLNFREPWPEWDEKRIAGFREFLRHFAEQVLSGSSHDLADAAGRGIQQAIELIKDPQYYEKRKIAANKRTAARAAKRKVEREQEQIRKVIGPSPEEISNLRRRYEYDIRWHTDALAASRKKLSELNEQNPPISSVQAGCVQ